MSGEEPEKPSGYADPSGTDISEMVGNSWPGTDKQHFDDRHAELDRVHKDLTRAKEGWQSGQSHIGSGVGWAGVSATNASAKADTHTKSMEGHEGQLSTAKSWTQQAGDLIKKTKDAIVHNVGTAVGVMTDTINQSEDGKITGEEATNIRTFTRQTNEAVNQWAANTALGKEGTRPEPPSLSEEQIKDARDKRGDGATDDAVISDDPMATFTNVSLSAGEKPELPAGTPPADAGPSNQHVPEEVSFNTGEKVELPAGTPPADAGPSNQHVPEEVSFNTGEKVELPAGAPVVQTPITPSNPGKAPAPSPTTPVTTATPAASTGGSAALGAPSGSGASGAPSPLSGGLGGSGVDQAASASQTAGQAPVGAAPADPLQAFSQGFADSAGTPVHAASTGTPPPLAPSPAVPASDALAPASTHSAPTSLTGAQAPAAPVQGPPAGGSLGMGGGMPSMPLGPPPTAPPAAPMAPPPAVAPPPAPPANIAGGAQIAPIPVSAARAERDAAQSAAKRSGSDPLTMARRIAAALNAPGMVGSGHPKFFWMTAVTVDGKIVVANNYGLAYIPEQVRLPELVNMASADESISPAERASWVNQPTLAVQRWAQHHDTELRAVIATEAQFKNSDAGVHQEVLTPEDIPASGQMAGRDRLKVIAPQIADRLGQISDADLVKVLPPAPADTNPPEDRRSDLWAKVWQSLSSRSPRRVEMHLEALMEYAVHAQEQAIYGAHTAAQPEEQRRDVGEFIYWQHLGQLMADAMAS
ncbi:hypothetical protein ACPCIR_15045 [Mycobacterium sp. NPDC051198]